MTGTTRRRSLFWTIAGVFFLMVVLGTLGQWLVATTVLRPLENRDARARAELVASTLAGEIVSSPEPLPSGEVARLLARHRAELGARPAWIVFRGRDGAIVSDPPWRARQIAALLSGATPPEPPSEGTPRPAFRIRPELLAKRAVARGPDVLGEILVVRPARLGGGPGSLASPTSLLVFPIAAIASACAGLLMVRILVRRLRAMEMLAARVAEGDLSARIDDTSGDEIGRLAERLDRMTERLSEARARLDDAENQRRQLFADITHELATPLTSIRGYAETLLDPGVPMSEEERSRYVHGVLEESRRLDRLISDLFDLARLEAEASPMLIEPIDWADLCRNTLERFQPRFHAAGLRLAWRQALERAPIDADGRRMEQVLDNLLVNALRYVPAGGQVEVSLDQSPERPERFRLAVSDDGPGLSAEERSRVFERFYRGTGARGAAADGGSGLGLAIVREIVERHGGTARAEARGAKGLSIILEIPKRP